ncbi:flagellar hook-associated protein FlgK [Frigoribacterium sp. VKM Ac-1396]|uniref:flagellar hook-associated protein FlgK n=1 Tax=Frigoribacterium sp. VKM Ac-1396 TaxID=2783821 RepID=UPI00188A4AB4|nr:flagellar hook-associated protein FlgK [Frigoribacterium sp. VKM Ac-1396]MBF4600724.1 flagellar hook-associated protein FlgK [Frigoribacterium sp. VKM Ac-1396]
MGSTFGGLNTAYRGLTAARTGLDVVGQNIANVNTDGYTRQRVTQSSIEAAARVGLYSTGVQPGQGASVDGIARIGDRFADAQVRGAAGAAGYQGVRASVTAALESSLAEPGTTGLSTQLTKFWSAWQDVSNNPSAAAPAAVLLGQAQTIAGTLASGYKAVDDQWTAQRQQVDGLASQLNTAATQVADLNVRIRTAQQQGVSTNELVDARSVLTEKIATLAGGTVRDNADGTVDVLVGGNALVSGDSARQVRVTGDYTLATATAGVSLEWTHRPGDAVALDGGSIAGSLSVLAPAEPGGAGGVLAEAAASYDALATQLATQVNAVHATGTTADGTTGHAFFAFTAGVPAARGLTVVPTSAATIASGNGTGGALDGSVARAIGQIGLSTGSPDRAWGTIVSTIGAVAQTESDRSTLTDLSATSAKNRQLSTAGVSLDEENVNLLTYQHAYQGAARVMTAIDEMLDTLINGMGRVGR